MTKIEKLSDAEFQDYIDSATQPVLVDFWAKWCGPCTAMSPVLEQVATDFSGKLVVTKLNVDANPQTSAKYGVRTLPALLLFVDGKLVSQHIGFATLSEIKAFVGAHMCG